VFFKKSTTKPEPSPDSTRKKGRAAEQVAADYLESRGYRIVERNFQCAIGEIDIIAHHNGDLVFIEVRSGSSPRTVNPAYSINRTKQNKIAHVAQYYLSRFRNVPPARFDVVLVRMSQTPQIELIPDAFSVEAGVFGF
jgi:putative endonuclease